MSVMSDSVPQALGPPAFFDPEALMRLSVEQYHQMIQGGILTDDDKVELLDGLLVRKMPKSPRHRLATALGREALENVLPPGYFVDAQEPFTSGSSEPEPDLMAVRGQRRDYRDRHPGPRDLAMVLEVSDSTLSRDQGWKRHVYARAGVPYYWIIALPDEQLIIFSQPTGAGESADYGTRVVLRRGEKATLILDGQEIGQIVVDDLLP